VVELAIILEYVASEVHGDVDFSYDSFHMRDIQSHATAQVTHVM